MSEIGDTRLFDCLARIAALVAALEWALGRIQEPTLIRGQNDAHCAAYARARAALAATPAPEGEP